MAHPSREMDFKSKTRCRHFDEEGRSIGKGCKYGSRCRYQHPPWPEMRDRPSSRERPRRRNDMDSAPHRSRSQRSRSPPPRGTTGGSRRDEEQRRRQRDSGLPRDSHSRSDYKGHRRTDSNRSNESYSKRGTRDDRKQDLGWDRRNDERVKKTRFDDTEKRTVESSTVKSPLSAPSVKEASATQSSHSRIISQAVEESLLHSAGNSPMRSEQADTPKTSSGPPVLSALSAVTKIPKEMISGEFGMPLEQVPLSRSIFANVDTGLEPRPVSAEESKLINGIWDHRVGTLAKLQDLLTKKDELSFFLRDAKIVQSTEQGGSGQFQSLIERLETQIQKAELLITDLWRELVDDELNLVQAMGSATGTAAEHERLRNAEKSIVAMEMQAGASLEDKGPAGEKEKDEPPEAHENPHPGGSSDPSEYLHLEDLKIDDLEDQLRVREAELQELEFGFGTEEFRNMVHSGLKKLKRHGRIGTVSGPALSEEEERHLDELGVQLAVVESWAANYDARIGERDREELLWSRQYEQDLNQIESASNAVVLGNKLLQQAETRLEKTKLGRLSAQDAELKAQKLAEEVSAGSGTLIEQHWRQLLEATRLETRGALDRSLNDFKVFIGEVEEEEGTTWGQNERKLLEEVAQKLEKTFKWQDAVVKWLEKDKKSRGLTL